MSQSTPPNFARIHNEEFVNVVKDLYTWEEEIKEIEKNILNKNKGENKILKSQEDYSDNSDDNCETFFIDENNFPKDISTEALTSCENVEVKDISSVAEILKNQGNILVQQGVYDKAKVLYTEATYYDNSNAIFFANRALCNYKLKNYENCIEDCNQALKLDPQYVKAYYRKAQALESLKKFNEAYVTCMTLLDIDPSNKEAISMKSRLIELTDFEKIEAAEHSDLNESNVVEVKTIRYPLEQAATTISRKIKCKRIEKNEKPVSQNNYVKGSQSKDSNTWDELKEKLEFLNKNSSSKTVNESEDKKFIQQSQQANEQKEKCTEDLAKTTALNSNSKYKAIQNRILQSSEFYLIWKELQHDQKFAFLKTLKVQSIDQMLGSRFDSDIFSEILLVLSENCNKDLVFSQRLLFYLTKHPRINLIKVFCSSKDLEALKKIVSCIEPADNMDKVVTDSIKHCFLDSV